MVASLTRIPQSSQTNLPHSLHARDDRYSLQIVHLASEQTSQSPSSLDMHRGHTEELHNAHSTSVCSCVSHNSQNASEPDSISFHHLLKPITTHKSVLL